MLRQNNTNMYLLNVLTHFAIGAHIIWFQLFVLHVCAGNEYKHAHDFVNGRRSFSNIICFGSLVQKGLIISPKH